MSLNYNQPAVSRPFSSSPLDSFAFVLALLVALPVLAVGVNLFSGGTAGTWSHLMDTVLPEYVANSIWLCLGVGLGCRSMGTGAAWLVALNDFPGRRIAEWALLLPMAMPAYVLAYTYTDFLQFVGPVQTSLARDLRLEKGRLLVSRGAVARGAPSCCFPVCLYPYVYLLVRTAFLERPGGMIEAARALGLNPGRGSGAFRFRWRVRRLPPAWRWP
jgi:iron(III) transport system permease protein